MKKQTSILLWALLLGILSFSSASAALTPEEQQAIAQVKTFNTAFKAIAREVTPSVVTINVIARAEERTQRGRRFNPWGFMPETEIDPERESTGSGIVMTKTGYILTNHHVAGKAEKLTVRLSDNREFDAELVGSDPRTDIAVIKIDATDLKPAQIGKSDHVQIGEWVLAIGAPFNFNSTVTAGIVSATGRRIDILRDASGLSIEDFIQVDAAINPGNSGGALVNLNGEVIGVNTAIAGSRTGTFVGYAFSVPIDLAKKVMDDIIEHGEVKRGILGVALEEVTAVTAEAYGMDRPKGVLIGTVFENTPAEKAGLKERDIILSVDGQSVNRSNQLQSIIGRKRPGDKVTLKVFRRKKHLTITATLSDKISEDMQQLASRQRPDKSKEISEIGLTVQDITPELARQAGLPKDIEGVLVTDVSRQARRAGFFKGDVIQSVLQYPIEEDIKSINAFEKIIAKLEKGRAVVFYVENDGNRRSVEMRLPE